MVIALLLLQTAPDIEIGARVGARSMAIESKGQAALSVRSAPDGGNIVDVRAPPANGRRTLEDVDIIVRAEARIADDGADAQNSARPKQ